MATIIQSTALDFDQIKGKLKTFFEQQSEFADYDFEAAGLNNLLDVMAYNTHYNGLIANFALNESFLTSAQLRSSVSSHAESLGYTPRSVRSASASLNLSITNTSIDRSGTVSLASNTQFTSQLDGVVHSFQTLEPISAVDNGSGIYNFTTATGSFAIPVFEGAQITKSFIVGDTGDRQIYVVPDKAIDTSSIVVRVYDTTSSSTYVTYTPLDKAASVTSSSTYYDIHEAPNGFYELHFSDGVTTGVAPTVGNKIVMTYLRSSGEAANRASSFIPSSTVSMDGSNYPLVVVVKSRAAGGAEKESIESIRQNAPIAFASQQRLVTALDYEGLIKSAFGNIRDVKTWGGEENDPPYYGKAIVSLAFDEGVNEDSQVAIKNSIKNSLTNNLSIMSIDTMFIDPIQSYMGCQITFNYNPNLSSTSVSIAQAQIITAVQQYFADNLNVFGGEFRRSNLLSIIDNLSPAILDSQMNVTIQRRFVPLLNVRQSYFINFPVALAQPTSLGPTITSSQFYYEGKLCSLKNEATSTLQVVDVTGVVIVDNIGNYNPVTGVVSLVGFNPTSIPSFTDIRIDATPANVATVKSSKNYIIGLDTSTSYAVGALDYQRQ